jgi:hypothetical protein
MLDSEMDQIIGTIVDSLFSVCVTLGSVPIIRCPKGEAAEIVGEVRYFNFKIFQNILFI